MSAIRELRQRQGRTIAELALRLGVTESTLRNWERGRHLPKSAVMRRKIARVLGVQEAQLGLSVQAGTLLQDERPLIAAAIVPNPDNRQQVLMTERRFAAERVWSWPSGHVKQGEQPTETALRELNEELVVQNARAVSHLGEAQTSSDVSRYWGHRFRHGYRMHLVHIEISSPAVEVVDHEELLRADWLSLDQLREALHSLPPDLADAAVQFARQAIAESVEEATV